MLPFYRPASLLQLGRKPTKGTLPHCLPAASAIRITFYSSHTGGASGEEAQEAPYAQASAHLCIPLEPAQRLDMLVPQVADVLDPQVHQACRGRRRRHSFIPGTK